MAENAVPKFNVEAFNPKKAELASLVEKYKDLKINGVDDKDGYERVRKARIELKNTRCDIKNKLKEARDPAIAFQNAVLQLEKDLVEIIEPTEEALEKEEKRIEDEKERIKREAEEKELKRLQAMVDKLAAVGYPSSVNALKDVSEADFETLLADVTKKRDEANRAAAEAAAKAEADRKALEEAQAKLEADKKKLAEEQAKIEADKKANEELAAKLAEDQRKLEEERKAATEDERETVMRDTYGIPEVLDSESWEEDALDGKPSEDLCPISGLPERMMGNIVQEIQAQPDENGDILATMKDFANTVHNLAIRVGSEETYSLLGRLSWTVGKQYDEEEQLEALLEECTEWAKNPDCFNR